MPRSFGRRRRGFHLAAAGSRRRSRRSGADWRHCCTRTWLRSHGWGRMTQGNDHFGVVPMAQACAWSIYSTLFATGQQVPDWRHCCRRRRQALRRPASAPGCHVTRRAGNRREDRSRTGRRAAGALPPTVSRRYLRHNNATTYTSDSRPPGPVLPRGESVCHIRAVTWRVTLTRRSFSDVARSFGLGA